MLREAEAGQKVIKLYVERISKTTCFKHLISTSLRGYNLMIPHKADQTARSKSKRPRPVDGIPKQIYPSFLAPISSFRLSLCCTNMGVVHLKILRSAIGKRVTKVRRWYLGSKFQARERLAQMGLQRTNHDEHERFGIPTQRILQQVCQL